MAAARDGNRLITSFVPSLRHCASVKTAIPLFQEFGVELLDEAFDEIKRGSEEGGEKCRPARKRLLHIPAHLRWVIMHTVHGLFESVHTWKYYYEYDLEFTDVEGCFQFRSDGSIDAVKSAQNLVRNAKFDIKQRFEVACVFCLVESVEALWAEMMTSGEAESFGTRNEYIVSLWVGWLNECPRVTSALSFIESLGTLIPSSQILNNPGALVPRFSAIFPLLRPEDRENCLDLLDRFSFDDLRSCLYTITTKEEEQILRNDVFKVLSLHLTWPLQTFFLEIANKLWDYIDVICYLELLTGILNSCGHVRDFDYSRLLEKFWNLRPHPFKEMWERCPYFRQLVVSYLRKEVCQ